MEQGSVKKEPIEQAGQGYLAPPVLSGPHHPAALEQQHHYQALQQQLQYHHKFDFYRAATETVDEERGLAAHGYLPN
jgi:hypothetical protein